MPPSRRGSRHREVPLITIVAVAVAIAAVLSLLWLRRGSVDSSTRPHSVTYRTEGTAATTTVVFWSPNGTHKETGAVIPLTTAADNTLGLHFTMYSGNSADLTVRNETGIGAVTCVIEVDGTETTRKTSTDPYGTAHCKATVP